MNSLLKRPIPSASLASTLATSPVLPMFAYRWILCPLFVSVVLPFNSLSIALWRNSSSFWSWYFFRVSASGSTIREPVLPSTTAIFPSMLSSYSILISAGIFIVLARIAVWELEEPFLVTNARTLLLSICTVSLGARSSATIIDGSAASISPSSCPDNTRTRRSEISFTSAALAFM